MGGGTQQDTDTGTTRALSTRIKLSQGKQNKERKKKGERETIVTMYTTNKNFKKISKLSYTEIQTQHNTTQISLNFFF